MRNNIKSINNNNSQVKVRESGLELFRIITMILIVAHHYVVNSGIVDYLKISPTSFKSLFFYCVGAFGKIGINCFVLITGYFMCRSKITLKKFLKLFLEVMFYKIIITIIFVIVNPSEWSIKSFIKTILPMTKLSDNFTGCYLVFFLFIPFLNVLINGLNEKTHGLLLALCLGAFSVFPNIPSFSATINYVMWFMIIYLIGAYISKYQQKLFSKQKLWIAISVLSFIFSILSVVATSILNEKLGTDKSVYYFVADSNKVLAVITSVSAFIVFKNLKMKYCKTINVIASATFGVLLIHANSDAMRTWLWRDFLQNKTYVQTNQAYLHVMISVLLVYVVCTIIDLLRIYFIEKPFFKWYDKKSRVIKGEK